MHNRNKIQVYHGSDHIIKTPIYLGGKDDNDYGNGFYTTEYEDRAKSWAALNGNPSRSIVNKYELDKENKDGYLALRKDYNIFYIIFHHRLAN